MLPRQKRRAAGGQIGNKIVNAIYHKMTEVVENMAVLTEAQPLTDTTILLVRIYTCAHFGMYLGLILYFYHQ